MSVMRPFTIALSGALLAFATSQALSQQTSPNPADQGKAKSQPELPKPATPEFNVAPPPADDNDFKLSSEVEVVLLDVSVKDANGGFVSGLNKGSFKIFENRIEQPISLFSAQDAPVTVGLVVDNSGSVRPKKPEIVTAALTFVTQSNQRDEMFIVNFNDRVFKGLPENVPFTGESKVLRQALLTTQPQGRTALNDAIKIALEHLEQGRLDKKTLVVISDGGDNASNTTKNEILRLVESSQATIYTVGIFNPDDKDKNPGFLRELARITGGEAFIPENTSHLVGICEKIAHDIRSRYSIGYSPSNRNHDGKIRRLRVVATGENGRKLDVRSRTHYYAKISQLPPEQSSKKDTR